MGLLGILCLCYSTKENRDFFSPLSGLGNTRDQAWMVLLPVMPVAGEKWEGLGL